MNDRVLMITATSIGPLPPSPGIGGRFSVPLQMLYVSLRGGHDNMFGVYASVVVRGKFTYLFCGHYMDVLVHLT